MVIREPAVWIAVALLLAGCATRTVGSAQEQCEKQYGAFPDVVTCLKDAVASGSATWGPTLVIVPSTNRTPTPELKLYLLKAEQLSQRVQKGEISDLDARLELQQLYVDLRNQSQQRQSATKPKKEGMNFSCKDSIARGDELGIRVHCQ